MIKIPLYKNIYLTSDSRCFKIEKAKILKGKEVLSPIGYYTSLENCLYDALEVSVRLKDINSLKQLFEEYRKSVVELKKQFEVKK